jgi:hypothetical protein
MTSHTKPRPAPGKDSCAPNPADYPFGWGTGKPRSKARKPKPGQTMAQKKRPGLAYHRQGPGHASTHLQTRCIDENSAE